MTISDVAGTGRPVSGRRRIPAACRAARRRIQSADARLGGDGAAIQVAARNPRRWRWGRLVFSQVFTRDLFAVFCSMIQRRDAVFAGDARSG
jgi:hypothetical protein